MGINALEKRRGLLTSPNLHELLILIHGQNVLLRAIKGSGFSIDRTSLEPQDGTRAVFGFLKLVAIHS